MEGAEIDISSGSFTAGYPGIYQVSWSLYAADLVKCSEMIKIYLRKNKEVIKESIHISEYVDHEGSETEVREQGGVTLLLHLVRGDSLDLWCENCNSGINNVMFCISLGHFDIE